MNRSPSPPPFTRPLRLAALCVMVLLGASCGDDEDSPFGVEVGTLELRAVLPEGDGAPGVELVARWNEGGSTREASRTTDADGRAVVGRAEVGTWEVSVTSFGPWAPAPSLGLPLQATVEDDRTTVVRLDVVPGG